MRSYLNPFRFRTSEQMHQQGLERFLRTYGSEVLGLLPEELWDRPLIIRSAPGGGKTSLLRAFMADALLKVTSSPDEFPDLHERLTELGAIDSGQPAVIGARISLRFDYQGLMDLTGDAEIAKKLFLRFLDAHIVRAFLEAALTLKELRFPEDVSALSVAPDSEGEEFLGRIGGTKGQDLWDTARESSRSTRDMLDAVLPISWTGVFGHAGLYSLQALSGAEVYVRGKLIPGRPLVMFDDGQHLAPQQRTALLEAITNRDLRLARWYTERFEALDPREVIGDGEPDRGYTTLNLERETRSMGGTHRRGRRLRPFERTLLDVADSRARSPLIEHADETETPFSGLLQAEPDDVIADRVSDTVQVQMQRVISLAAGRSRYDQWVKEASQLTGYASLVRWRELEIVINRDRDRSQLELLDLPLDADALKSQSGSPIREAAALFLRREFGIPYYWGADRIARLGSQNFEQFLGLSGYLFDEMLALITLGHRPLLGVDAQDKIVQKTSEAMWRAIPQRRSYGRDIQHLLLRIASLAQRDTYRPKASYAPGVTGTALSMRDRARLLDPDVRSRIPGAPELYRALGGAVGHNLLFADLDRSVKNNRWMVLYLNRLLCARFELPVGFGGFRERSLEEMASWMAEPIDVDLSGYGDQMALEVAQ